MRGLVVCAVALAGCGSQVACFSPDDTTPGWKRVELPADAPSLAAPSGIEQFRTDSPVMVWEWEDLEQRAYDLRPGVASISFDVPGGIDAAAIELAQPLDGARVEIQAIRPFADPLPLVTRRVQGAELQAVWDDPLVERIDVTIHHHLRARPAVRVVRTGRWVAMRDRPATPEAFLRPDSLYYRQPDRSILLCNAPGRIQSVRANGLTGAPRDTTVRRRSMAWADTFGWRMK